jgi:hypothetical protein
MLSAAQSKLLRTLEAQPYAELSPDNKLLLKRMQEKARGLPTNKALGKGKSILDMIQIGREEGTGAGEPANPALRRAVRPPLSQPCRKCSTSTRAKAAVGKNIYRCPKCHFVWSGSSMTSIQSIAPVPVYTPPLEPGEGGPDYVASPQKSRILSTGREE